MKRLYTNAIASTIVLFAACDADGGTPPPPSEVDRNRTEIALQGGLQAVDSVGHHIYQVKMSMLALADQWFSEEIVPINRVICAAFGDDSTGCQELAAMGNSFFDALAPLGEAIMALESYLEGQGADSVAYHINEVKLDLRAVAVDWQATDFVPVAVGACVREGAASPFCTDMQAAQVSFGDYALRAADGIMALESYLERQP